MKMQNKIEEKKGGKELEERTSTMVAPASNGKIVKFKECAIITFDLDGIFNFAYNIDFG